MELLIFFFIISLFAYFAVKSKQTLAYFLRFVIGFITMIVLLQIVYHSTSNHPGHGAVLFDIANLLGYVIFFLASSIIFLFHPQSIKKMFFMFPGMLFLLMMLVIVAISNSFKSLSFFAPSLLLSFFPSHIYAYYKEYSKKKHDDV